MTDQDAIFLHLHPATRHKQLPVKQNSKLESVLHGGHSSGKPGKVRNFTLVRKNLRETDLPVCATAVAIDTK